MRITLVIALAAAALASVLVAPSAVDGAAAREWKKVRVALDGAYPPFSRKTAEGRVEGFDVEVADAVCGRLGVECERVVSGWDDLFTALLGNRVDLVIASVPVTDEVRRRFEVTRAYHRIGPRFATCDAARLAAALPGSLGGLRLGVRAGTAHAAWAAEAQPQAVRSEFADETAAATAALDGRLDYVFGDTIALFDWLDRQAPRGRCGFVGEEVSSPRHFGAGAGIVFRREDRDLGIAVDKALGEMARDGTLDRLAGHWFPFAIR